jgi:hypothetical protein
MFLSMASPPTQLDARTAVAWAATLLRAALAPMLVMSLLVGAYALRIEMEPPGLVIRHDLAHAGSAVARLPWATPNVEVQQAVSGYFRGYRASVDATGFPAYVVVTLHNLDAATCSDAYRLAGRIEGTVVVAIEDRDHLGCRDDADVSWRIMP